MKIIGVRTQVMGVPSPGGHAPRRNWVFVFIETDEGIRGVGEATTEWHEQAVAAMVEEHLAPMLVGEDPTQIERLWQRMYRWLWWRGGVVASSAISGVDQALWDITGKAYGLPVYKLLGGACRDKVRVYARHDLGLATYAEEARVAVEEGFDAFKFGHGGLTHPFDDERQVDVLLEKAHSVREAVGPKIELMVDCAGLFSVKAATRLIEGLKPLNLLFVEEPVNADTPAGLLQLRAWAAGVNLAAGERLCTRWAFREWLEKGVVDVIQTDISHTGGISEILKIAHYAEVYGVRMAPHNPYGPVALAAAVHAALAMPNFLILEHCRLRPGFDAVQRVGPAIVNGYVAPPELPGLGIELDEEYIAAHPYTPLPVGGQHQSAQADGSTPLI